MAGALVSMSEVELDILDLKEVILTNNSFGPSDVGEIQAAIAENYGHFGELRDAVNELEVEESLSPAEYSYMLVWLIWLDVYINLDYLSFIPSSFGMYVSISSLSYIRIL